MTGAMTDMARTGFVVGDQSAQYYCRLTSPISFTGEPTPAVHTRMCAKAARGNGINTAQSSFNRIR